MAVQIAEREIGGERVLELGFATLVASKSQPGSWHQVSMDTCDCLSFQYRGRCRHLAALAQPVPFAIPTGKAALALCSLDDD